MPWPPMTAEQGKTPPRPRARSLRRGLRAEWFAEAKRAYGGVIPSPSGSPDRRDQGAVGVCAAITPWNFPSAMIAARWPRLAANCTIVLKPVGRALSALALNEPGRAMPARRRACSAWSRAKASAIGGVTTASPIVRAKLTFTGSTPVGKLLLMVRRHHQRAVAGAGGIGAFHRLRRRRCGRRSGRRDRLKYRNAARPALFKPFPGAGRHIYDTFAAKLAEARSPASGGQRVGEGVA